MNDWNKAYPTHVDIFELTSPCFLTVELFLNLDQIDFQHKVSCSTEDVYIV